MWIFSKQFEKNFWYVDSMCTETSEQLFQTEKIFLFFIFSDNRTTRKPSKQKWGSLYIDLIYKFQIWHVTKPSNINQ